MPLLLLAYLAFLGISLPDGLLGVSWPSMSVSFGQPVGALGSVLPFAVVSSMLSSASTGTLLPRIGLGSILACSIGLYALALLAQSLAPAFWVFIVAAVVLAAGSGAIDAGLNAFAAREFNARQITWLHGVYGLGAAAGPLVFVATTAAGLSWRWAFALVGALLAVMTVVFALTRHLWRTPQPPPRTSKPPGAGLKEGLRLPVAVWSGVMVFALQTGVESGTALWAGVLYALNRITGKIPAKLQDWLFARPVTNDNYPPGLYLGQAGIAWVTNELGNSTQAVRIMRQCREHKLLLTSPNVMHGASGYGMACLQLWSIGAGDDCLDEAIRVGEYLLRSVTHGGRGAYWPSDDGTVRVGYAYGGTGIALFLVYLHAATGDTSWRTLGRQALDFELSHAALRDGRVVGFPEEATDEPASAPVLKSYWDAGSAGVLTTLARYVVVEDDPELELWVKRLQSDINRKYVVFPQLFHGLAGLGNALLDLWDYGLGERSLEEAWRVASGILLFRIERDEGLAFPGEQAIRESADFATGSAGICLFLDRLLHADNGVRVGNFNFVLDDLLARVESKSPS